MTIQSFYKIFLKRLQTNFCAFAGFSAGPSWLRSFMKNLRGVRRSKVTRHGVASPRAFSARSAHGDGHGNTNSLVHPARGNLINWHNQHHLPDHWFFWRRPTRPGCRDILLTVLAPTSAKTRKLGVRALPRRRWDAMHCSTMLHREDCRARALLGPCARYSGGRGGFQ